MYNEDSNFLPTTFWQISGLPADSSIKKINDSLYENRFILEEYRKESDQGILVIRADEKELEQFQQRLRYAKLWSPAIKITSFTPQKQTQHSLSYQKNKATLSLIAGVISDTINCSFEECFCGGVLVGLRMLQGSGGGYYDYYYRCRLCGKQFGIAEGVGFWVKDKDKDK